MNNPSLVSPLSRKLMSNYQSEYSVDYLKENPHPDFLKVSTIKQGVVRVDQPLVLGQSDKTAKDRAH